MRKLTMLGAAALLLAFGAVNAYAGGGAPGSSPNDLLYPQYDQPENTGTKFPWPREGRSADVDENAAPAPASGCHPERARIHGVWRHVQVCD
jgi:hypothetical protein